MIEFQQLLENYQEGKALPQQNNAQQNIQEPKKAGRPKSDRSYRN